MPQDGVTHDADVVVYATGPRHTEVLWPMQIERRNGGSLICKSELKMR
jgi:4-hydroxyacetophenone monooxygenase